MDGDTPSIIFGVMIGIGLSAACGFRVFVPLLVVSIAGRTGQLSVAQGWEWMTSVPAIIAFSTATVLEITAYYIPWVDNFLDAVAGPAAVVAGTIVTASFIGDMSPMLKWGLAAVAGGGAAGVVQAATTAVRATSTATTGGAGNSVVSTVEAGASLGLSILTVVVPFIAAAVALGIVFLVVRFVWRRVHRRRERVTAEAAEKQTMLNPTSPRGPSTGG